MKSEPTTADPRVAPIWRKKLLAAVAVPTSRSGKAFCTTSTRICMDRPRPTPRTARAPQTLHSASSTESVDIRNRPRAMIAEPTIGSVLYRPDRVTWAPARIEVVSMAPIIGIISRPATVADLP